MKVNQLIEAIDVEHGRIWGDDGFNGSSEEYEWLQCNYGIKEEDDVLWQLIIEYDANILPEEELEDQELMVSLEDEEAVQKFLQHLLVCYKSASMTYPTKV